MFSMSIPLSSLSTLESRHSATQGRRSVLQTALCVIVLHMDEACPIPTADSGSLRADCAVVVSL